MPIFCLKIGAPKQLPKGNSDEIVFANNQWLGYNNLIE